MALSSAQAPMANEYAGDEVSAIVLDPGYSTTRAGFAGEDVPKSVVPTYYGVRDGTSVFGDNSIHNPSSNLEIRNPWSSDGIVEDWDTAVKLWEYSITSRLTGPKATSPAKNGLNDTSNGDMDVDMEGTEDVEKPLEGSPLLMTEPGWSNKEHREKCIEVAMEQWGAPAFYIQRTGCLAAFASGKPTALVVDVGATTTSVTPVIDGMVIKKGSDTSIGVVKSPLAGNFVSEQLRMIFAESKPAVPLTPHFMVASKTPVEAETPAQAVLKKIDVHPSFRKLEEDRVLTEFKESVVQVWGGPGRLSTGDNESVAKASPGRPFEMPDGWNKVFGAERFRATEGLFDAKAAMTDADHPRPRDEQTIPQMIVSSLNGVDIEQRPNLLASIVVTGGGSLLYGFTDRLNQELAQIYPGPRIRLQAPGNVVERKYASWLGGSILGSLGSFHQLWVSKKEYEEHGPSIVEKRCK
ncbi:actin-like protein-like protein 6A [Saccharata proteae CBS 121410]|uniref:Actin-like protein-like protein 6A n=1 Tax=Saccharata proteae CBS 121410 TaxID=1314787 RepID=A0A9P4LUX9_9PEZI|nr:actin-like protein-like protein 6A [Saccharata proteae CBS 121410]